MKERWRTPYKDALAAAEGGDFGSAASLFAQSIDAGSPRWEPYYGRAWALLRKLGRSVDGADLTTVESDLRRALDLGGPFCADAASLLGCLMVEQRRHDEALPLLLQAFGRASESERVEDGIADSLTAVLDDLENTSPDAPVLARFSVLEAMVKASDLPLPLMNGFTAEIVASQAYCLEAAGRANEAQDCLDRLLQLAPSHPRLPTGVAKRPAKAAAVAPGKQEPTFADIGGIDVPGTFQAKLRDIFETYFSRSDIETTRKRIEEYGQNPTRSILLFGPSGCGKTYIIRAFAGEYRRRYRNELPIHRANLDELFDRYVGESEKNLTRLFDETIATQPSILFFDEIDSIGGSRDKSQDWKSAQTSHLLQQFDRLQNEGAFVIVFGCSNRMMSIELALLRRFDELMPVEMPNQSVREKIFEVLISRLAPRLRPDRPAYGEFGRASHGLTPGDIDKVVKKSVDTIMLDLSTGAEPRRLENGAVLRTLQSFKNPHVRTWLTDAVSGLRAAGHADMVEDVERMYGPYVETLESRTDVTEWSYIPEDAFTEEQEFDLGVLQAMRRRP